MGSHAAEPSGSRLGLVVCTPTAAIMVTVMALWTDLQFCSSGCFRTVAVLTLFAEEILAGAESFRGSNYDVKRPLIGRIPHANQSGG